MRSETSKSKKRAKDSPKKTDPSKGRLYGMCGSYLSYLASNRTEGCVHNGVVCQSSSHTRSAPGVAHAVSSDFVLGTTDRVHVSDKCKREALVVDTDNLRHHYRRHYRPAQARAA